MQTVLPTNSDFGVQLGDQTFPAIEQAQEVVVPRSPEVIVDDSLSRVQRQLTETIAQMLPFYSLPENVTDKRTLFTNYVDSVAVLRQCRQDVLELYRAMIETAMEFDFSSTLSEEARAEIIEEFMKDAEVPLAQPENLATADVAALEPAEIQARLKASLEKSLHTLIADLIEGLGLLTERSIAGLAHWTSSNTVKYHFFRRFVEEQSRTTRTKRGGVRRRSKAEAFGDFRRWKRVNKRLTTTKVSCRLAHHRHETIDAIHTSIDNSQVVMPQFVQALVRQIPDWMRPSISVIDGYLIRETVQEREICQRELTQVETFEELLYGHEPAVCLGPYVLTGWGPREIDAENQRRKQDTSVTAESHSARFWGASAAASQVFCVLFAHVGWLPLAAVLFIFGMASATLWISQASRVAGLALSEWDRQRITLGCLLLLGGLQLVLTPLSLLFILIGIPLFLAGTAILYRDRQTLINLITSRKEIAV